MSNSIIRLFGYSIIFLLSGCFDQPEPAYKSVQEGQRVYLKELGLADLKGQTFAEAVDYLNLDRNALTNVDEVTALVNLKWLRLNDNRLAALPDLSKLVNLRRIYLRGNRFEKVPETLEDLPALTDVDLSGNPVAEIPDWLAKKEGLVALSFTATKVTKLPEDLSAWRSLKQLQLGELNLTTNEMSRIRHALPESEVVF